MATLDELLSEQHYLIDWARLAALIDGEDCINLTYAGKRWLTLTVSITNCAPRIPQWCAATFGGKCRLIKRKLSKASWRPAYIWYRSTIDAEKILRGCLPYFIAKRDQAEIALASRAVLFPRGGRVKGRELTPEVVASREALRLQLRQLKHQALSPDVVQ